MPPEALDFSRRSHALERMDEPCSRDTLRACLRDIARSNRWTLGYRPLFRWLNEIARTFPRNPKPLRILDVGCGNGDLLRRVARWAQARHHNVELTGIDLNPDATAIAAEETPPEIGIAWVTGDVLAYQPAAPPDLVVSTLLTHHLSDEQIIAFLYWMEQHARLGWFINDLSRAAIPYHVFRIFARVMRFHPFVQYDGPLSVARAFVLSDWQRLCAAAGLASGDVTTEAFKPARLCVARRKPQ